MKVVSQSFNQSVSSDRGLQEGIELSKPQAGHCPVDSQKQGKEKKTSFVKSPNRWVYNGSSISLPNVPI